MKRLFYHGNSMRRVFREGDSVAVSPVEVSACRRGDIIVFAEAGGKLVIHRVVGITDGGLLTMGDNNKSPDAGVRAAGDELYLAQSFLRGKKEIRLHRGTLGMMEFRWHRLRRLFRLAGGFLWRRRPAVIDRWRIPLEKAAEGHIFGDVIYYKWRGMVIARVYADGNVSYTHWYWQLIFSVSVRKD